MGVNSQAARHREQAEELWEIALRLPPNHSQRGIIDLATEYERLADVIELSGPLRNPGRVILASGTRGSGHPLVG